MKKEDDMAAEHSIMDRIVQYTISDIYRNEPRSDGNCGRKYLLKEEER